MAQWMLQLWQVIQGQPLPAVADIPHAHQLLNIHHIQKQPPEVRVRPRVIPSLNHDNDRCVKQQQRRNKKAKTGSTKWGVKLGTEYLLVLTKVTRDDYTVVTFFSLESGSTATLTVHVPPTVTNCRQFVTVTVHPEAPLLRLEVPFVPQLHVIEPLVGIGFCPFRVHAFLYVFQEGGGYTRETAGGDLGFYEYF